MKAFYFFKIRLILLIFTFGITFAGYRPGNDVVLLNSDSFIYSNGFIMTKDYKTKSEILKSSAGIFGFHILGRRNIGLLDADFLHFLTIKNNSEEEYPYKELIKRLVYLNIEVDTYPIGGGKALIS